MKKFILALFIGFSIFATAQNKISGTITNTDNKNLEAVIISIPELQKETISDSNGNYNLNNLPNGNFKIIFSYFGYENQLVSVALKQNETILNIILSASTNHIDEIIVSTVFNKLQSENVMKVEHKSVKELQQKGVSTLIEGLATIPGVSQISTGTSIGKPVIRGLSGNRVLVYTQGVRLENQQFGEEHGLGLNDAGIESVEVIKGPASLLYGSDALGGVLYFNPEKFAKANDFETNFSHKLFSNTLGSNSSLGVKSSSENWKFLIRGSYNSHMDYKIPNGNQVINSRYNETDFKSGLNYTNSKFSSVLRYNFNQLNLGLPQIDGIQNSSRKPDYPSQRVDNHIVSLHNKFFLKKSKIEANFGYIFNDRKEFEDNPNPILQMDLETFNYDLKYYLPKSGKLETIFGIQGMNQTNKNSGQELLIPDAKTNDVGILVTSNYQGEFNTIQAGFRFDNRKINTNTNGIVGEEGYFESINKNFNSFNASLGYKTNLFQNLSFRLNVASGFRAPNLAELTSNGVHEGSNRYEIGNQNLKSEQNIQTDLNIEYGNSHFELFANGFYNHINNYIFITPNGNTIDDNDVYDYVQANAKLYGGETGIHFHPHPLDWLHITTSFETVIGQQDNNEYLSLIPANKLNGNLRTDIKIKNWLKSGYASLNIEHFFAQNKISQFETKTMDYSLVNIGLGGTIHLDKVVFDVNLNGNNLLNRNYISHLSRLKSDEIPNIGRNIVLGFNFKI